METIFIFKLMSKILFIDEDITYGEEVKTDQEKEQYNEIYVEGLSVFSYLDMYEKSDIFNIDDNKLKNLNPDGLYKTLLGLLAVRRKAQKHNPANSIKLKAYGDLINNHESFINHIMNLIHVHHKKIIKSREIEEFFE